MEDIGEVEAFAGSQLAAKVVALTTLVFTPEIIIIMIIVMMIVMTIVMMVI